MALSANTWYQLRNTQGARRRSYVIKTSAKIWQGAILAVNTAGRAYPAANDTTGKFIGISTQECLTGNGTTRVVDVLDNVEALMPLKTSMTAGHRMGIVYAFDDANPTNLTTLGPQMGTLSEFVAANSGWVALRQAVLVAGS
jgi:hypothetical protein